MKMISFDEFKNAVVDEIKKYLPESYRDAEISLKEIVKPNDIRLTGLLVLKDESGAAPMVYLEEFYKMVEAGSSVADVIRKIADMRVEYDVDDLGVNEFMRFEDCKDRILPRLYSREMNDELVNHMAYTSMEDFLILYYIELGETDAGRLSIPIDMDILNRWGVGVDRIHSTALDNQRRLSVGTLKKMREMLGAMMLKEFGIEEGTDESMEFLDCMFGPDTDDGMFVITNTSCINGASMVLDREFMDKAVEVLGDGFYVLPSSIHEVIALPDNGTMNVDEMESMVCYINRTQLRPEEVLSDHVYRYTSERGLVRAA